MDNDIRIGTMVNSSDMAGYIRQILPHGFESFSLSFWKTLGDTDLEKTAVQVNEVLSGSGAIVSSLSVFGNLLESDEDAETARESFRKAIDAAPAFGASFVTGFTGRVRDKSIPDNIARFREVWSPLAEQAAGRGVKIAWENCAMGGNWNSGDWNIAHNPDAWELMFAALPAENCGLQWEPCHQLVQLIDPLPQIREWGKKMFLIHGKDATVRHDIIRRHGVAGCEPFAWHRTPGFGDTNWSDLITELRKVKFKGSIDIEGWHDPVYCGDLEMTGQVHALNYLKRCRGGDFVPNPQA